MCFEYGFLQVWNQKPIQRWHTVADIEYIVDDELLFYGYVICLINLKKRCELIRQPDNIMMKWNFLFLNRKCCVMYLRK